MKTLVAFSDMTPTVDKGLTVIGALVTGLTLADVSTGVGLGVGIVTLCMIIPRAVLNWTELRDSNKAHREAREKAARLLDDAERESSDY
jgi:ABC-type transport system involved in cytochrome bd biosynthesis fused ATPase/permease subunit